MERPDAYRRGALSIPGAGPDSEPRGRAAAAERLLAHPIFKRVKVIKVNPDSPQRWGGRLKGAFRRLDPAKIPEARYADAATLKRGGEWGEDLALDDLPPVDLVVMGSVSPGCHHRA